MVAGAVENSKAENVLIIRERPRELGHLKHHAPESRVAG
jgi:hypothetical protein